MPKQIYIDTKTDDRGFLNQIYNLDLPKQVKRIYTVGNFSKSTIRGMHFHKKEWKYFYPLKGSFKFVISPKNKPGIHVSSYILTDKKPSILIIPAGNYNGWIALENNSLLLGISNLSLKDGLKDDARIDPKIFNSYFKTKNR